MNNNNLIFLKTFIFQNNSSNNISFNFFVSVINNIFDFQKIKYSSIREIFLKL